MKCDVRRQATTIPRALQRSIHIPVIHNSLQFKVYWMRLLYLLRLSGRSIFPPMVPINWPQASFRARKGFALPGVKAALGRLLLSTP
ncbi:hypothetical protein E2C01_048646 [Portunus trituberculatus]|uniref:Uncharacterized protein n=1 Tax=Portunus trituberculatus TaxID=210409 RepID=A0A5B7G4C4_PORTR|nr:hypothetical protein [Portunus trituberculatus]